MIKSEGERNLDLTNKFCYNELVSLNHKGYICSSIWKIQEQQTILEAKNDPHQTTTSLAVQILDFPASRTGRKYISGLYKLLMFSYFVTAAQRAKTIFHVTKIFSPFHH